MAGFHDLPDELLLSIIPCLALSSILPFSLINKHIYELCKTLILESQELYRKWGRVCIQLEWSTNLIMFLDTLFRDPSISWYIRELDTWFGNFDDWAFDAFGIDADFQSWEYSMPRLWGRIASSPLLEEPTRQSWLDVLVKAGELNAVLPATLVLSLLPELRTLIMPEQAETVLPWLRSGLCPSKLERINFARSNGSTTVTDVIDCLQVTPLRELQTGGVMSSEQMTFSTLLVDVCPLIKLNLAQSALSPRDLGVILQRIKRDNQRGGLKALTYSHREPTPRAGYQIFNGSSFIKMLLRYSWHSLIELDLDVTKSHYRQHHSLNKIRHSWLDKDIPTLGRGLKKFEKLKILRVSIEMLVDDWWISNEESDDELDAELDHLGIELVKQIPLYEVLPPNLQVLHICSKGYMQATTVVTEKLVALFKKESDAVPRLRELQVDWQLCEPWKELLKSYCKKRGMRFEYER
jgi:hypothetical protein